MQADLLKAADDFEKSLQQLADKIESDFDQVLRKVLFDLLSMLMEDTPKDTVRCAGSWSLDTHYSEWVLPPGDYREVDLSAKAQAIVVALPRSDVYVLYNNIEYLMALEDGHSKQAPSGFIANALAAFTEKINEAVRALEGVA